MRTPGEESAPFAESEINRQDQTYLPSPPHSPSRSQQLEESFDDGNDDNTAAGMADAQEQSMYQQDEDHTSDSLCAYDSEKITQSYTADDSIATAVPNRSRTPLSIQDDTEPRPVSTDSTTSPTPIAQETSQEISTANSTTMPHSSPLTTSQPAHVPTALFSPSPPPPTSSSPSEPIPASITTSTDSMITGLTTDFSKIRLTPSFTSSYFRPGSRFTGTQQSDRQIYNVDVEINNVSIPDSSVSGYLKICGLTDTHPTLTTYFEGEIIGTRHTFQTRHPGWGATDKTDMQHWARFPAWRPLAKEARRPGFSFGKEWWNRENIFMRWKEHFLVPDHRVRSIQGASFEGFYYICYNQVEGRISGIYFHAKSEKYQQLELRHVDDRGCLGAMEFR